MTGDPTDWVADDIPRDRRNGRPIEAFIDDFPMTATAREQLKSLHGSKRVTLERFEDDAAREEYLAGISYVEFLRRDWGLSEEAIGYFSGRTLDFFALPPSLVPALDAANFAYPGFAGIRLPVDESAAPDATMEDIVLARLRYDALDRRQQKVRIRLSSTVVRVVNGGAGVDVGCVGNADRRLHRLRARHVVLACFSMMIPYVLGGIDTVQAGALQLNVKAPLVYSKVLVRDWHPWVRLGVHEIYGVASHHSRVKLDYPVSMGGYRAPRSPDEPMVLHLVHVPTAPGVDDPRAALRATRATMLNASFANYESAIRRDLSRMLGPGGFDDGRDILGITVNRWSHGYSWGMNTLVDEPDAAMRSIQRARQPVGAVTIANSDAGWSAYAHRAIDEAHRAVNELPGSP